MKTKTHYLYSFIIILLTFALILTNVSKPKVEATTSPVETIPPIETTPPDEPTTDTQDIPSELYHDTYYTIATYSFCFGIFGLFTYYCKDFLYSSPKTLDRQGQKHQKLRKAIKMSRPSSEEGHFLFKAFGVLL